MEDACVRLHMQMCAYALQEVIIRDQARWLSPDFSSNSPQVQLAGAQHVSDGVWTSFCVYEAAQHSYCWAVCVVPLPGCTGECRMCLQMLLQLWT